MDDPLETLIYESLHDQVYTLKKEKGGDTVMSSVPKIDKAEIFNLLKEEDGQEDEQRSKVLLLLDGYDEIASLAFDVDHIASRVLDDIYTYPYLVVTSRPNALTTNMINRFGRKIESTGLSQGGVYEYINRYFSNQSKLLSEKVSKVFASFPEGLVQDSLFGKFAKDKDTLTLHTLQTIFEEPANYSRGNQDGSSEIKSLFLDLEDTAHLIDSYFKRSKDALILLCKQNADLSTVLSTPINAAMACLVSTDPDFSGTFSGDFNIGQLYESVIVWLGKRFESKFHNKDIKGIVRERIFALDEIRALELVAYEGLKLSKPTIEGTFIDAKARQIKGDLTLADVIKYGLLKLENANASDEVIEQDHCFIHLSFQEYMMAHLLKVQLLSDKENEFRAASQFIAEHRNEPKYLMTLKLLAGIITTQESSSSSVLPSSALARFWEAIVCNVDGVLELGTETKVKLLAHLLGQSKIRGQTNPRIPYLKQIEDLINSVILKDITKWEETIIASGYVSKGICDDMKATLVEVLHFGERESTNVVAFEDVEKESLKSVEPVIGANEVDHITLRTAKTSKINCIIEIITSLSNNKEFGGRTIIFNQLIRIIQCAQDWKVKKLALRKLSDFADESIPQSSLKECVNSIVPLIKESNFTSSVKSLAVKVTQLNKSLFVTEVIDILIPLLNESNSSVQNAASEGLYEVAQIPIADDAFHLLKPLLLDPKWSVKMAGAASMSTLIKASTELRGNIFSLLQPLFCNKDAPSDFKVAITKGFVAATKKEPSLAREILDFFKPALDTNVWGEDPIYLHINEIVATISDEEAFSLIEHHLLSDKFWCLRRAGVIICGKRFGQATTSPDKASRAVALLIPYITDPEVGVRMSIGGILGDMAKNIPELAMAVIPSLKILEGDKDWGVTCCTAYGLGRAIVAAPTDDTPSIIETRLQSTDPNIKSSAMEGLGEMIGRLPSLASRVLTLVEPILPDYLLQGQAVRILGKVAKADPGMVSTVLSLLQPQLSNWSRLPRQGGSYGENVKDAIFSTLGDVVEADHLQAANVILLVKERLPDASSQYHRATAELLGKLVVADTELASQVLPLLQSFLFFSKTDALSTVTGRSETLTDTQAVAKAEDVRKVGRDSLGKIAALRLDVAKTALDLFDPRLSDSQSSESREYAAEGLGAVGRVVPQLAQNILSRLTPRLSDVEPTNVRNAAARSLSNVMKHLPFNVIALMLTDDVNAIREEASKDLFLKLKDPSEVEKFAHEHILALLKIMEVTKGVEEMKELNVAAQKALQQMAVKLNDEGVAWISAHFDELPKAQETKSFLKDVYHKLLSKGAIDEVDVLFIIKLIKSGLTTTVTRSGDIIIDGATYRLSLTSKQYLDKITKAALNQEGDPLVQQYLTHEPMFLNGELGLFKAASDYADNDVLSLSGKIPLLSQKWLFTALRIDERPLILLLERRNLFGDHLIHKYDEHGQCVERIKAHPKSVDREMREKLFLPLDNASVVRANSMILEEDEGSFTSSSLNHLVEEKIQGKYFDTSAPLRGSGIFSNVQIQTLTKIDLLRITDPAEAGTIENALAIHHGGVLDRAKVKQGIESLEQEGMALSTYYRTFYWSMLNLFDAYRVLSTGKIEGNKDAEMSMGENLAVKGAKKLVEYGKEVAKGIPILGSVVGLLDTVIDDICDVIKDARFESKVNSINKIIQAKLGTVEDISINLAKIGLAITLEKKRDILDPKRAEITKDEGNFAAAKAWLGKKVEAIQQVIKKAKNEVLGKVELYDEDDVNVKMALEDVALTIAYLIKNYEAIIENKEPLDVQITRIVAERGFEKLLTEAGGKAIENASISLSSKPITEGKGNLNEIRVKPQPGTTQKGDCCTLM